MELHKDVQSLIDQFGLTLEAADTEVLSDLANDVPESAPYAAYMKGDNLIYYDMNAELSPEEFNFIILHELGHHILYSLEFELNIDLEEYYATMIAWYIWYRVGLASPEGDRLHKEHNIWEIVTGITEAALGQLKIKTGKNANRGNGAGNKRRSKTKKAVKKAGKRSKVSKVRKRN